MNKGQKAYIENCFIGTVWVVNFAILAVSGVYTIPHKVLGYVCIATILIWLGALFYWGYEEAGRKYEEMKRQEKEEQK